MSGPSHNSTYYCIIIILTTTTTVNLVITFMHDIYNYIPATKHVSRVYNVAAVLYLQFVLHVLLLLLLLLSSSSSSSSLVTGLFFLVLLLNQR